MNGSVLVSDDAIPAVQNGYWLVVLQSVRIPPVRNRLPVGVYIGYNGKWVSQPNTTINITINNGTASIELKREDGSTIATATTSPFTIENTPIVNSLGDEIASAQAQDVPKLIADQSAEGSTGLGGFTFPTSTVGIVPDVNYTDSDGSPATAPYGSDISCTPVTCPTLDQIIATYNGTLPVTLKSSVGNLNNPAAVTVIGTTVYILNSASPSYVQKRDINTGADLGTKLSLGNNASTISRSSDGTQYLVVGFGIVYIIRVSDDVTTATLSVAGGTLFQSAFNGADFAPNGNIWSINNTVQVNETTQLGVNVPPTIVPVALVRAYSLRRHPVTGYMWLGGYGSGPSPNIEIYDPTTRVITGTITITGSAYIVKSVVGITFTNTRYFVLVAVSPTISTTAELKGTVMMEINSSGAVITETAVPIASLGTNSQTVNGFDVYEGYDKLVTVFGSNGTNSYTRTIW